MTCPLNDSEAGGDLALIQTLLILLCKSSCPYAKAHLHGLGHPRQPFPRDALAEVTFSLAYFFAKFNQAFILGSLTRLGGRDNLGGRVVSPQIG